MHFARAYSRTSASSESHESFVAPIIFPERSASLETRSARRKTRDPFPRKQFSRSRVDRQKCRWCNTSAYKAANKIQRVHAKYSTPRLPMPDILENASRIENITRRNVFIYRGENAYSISIKHSRSGRTFPCPLPLLSPAKEFKNRAAAME